ncbi:MAG TPA: VOC family protein [Yinghuangia sp.]|uniref:VOC family protein n=1 Tax=Yinghuangia sp. YIM S10712 TaxID=3436930 RepID=UPI002BA16010|nr:VOC family protein [Yinghuangia sp.]
MSVDLNHTIVRAHDHRAAAEFLARILGLEAGETWGPFVPVQSANGVTLDYMAVPDDEEITGQHYAFLVSEEEFDGIFRRVREAGVTYYADPAYRRADEINHNDGGRGFYFRDPDGHSMEVITRPYGSGG